MLYRLWTVVSKFKLVITIYLIHRSFLVLCLVRCVVPRVVCYLSRLIYLNEIKNLSLEGYSIWELVEAGEFLEFVDWKIRI